MTREEFNSIYLVEPVFRETHLHFFVYKNDKVDYITPPIDLVNIYDTNQIDDRAIKKEIRGLADSYICERYEIEE